MLRIAAGAVLAYLVLAPLADAAEQGGPVAPRPLLDRLLPVEDLSGREWTHETLDGKIVIIDFWATWCAPCLAELPRFKRMHHDHHDDGLVILSVSVDQTEPRTLRRWIRDHEMIWPQIHDNRGLDTRLARQLGVETVPSTFLFDRLGRLVARDLEGSALEAAAESLVALGKEFEDGTFNGTHTFVREDGSLRDGGTLTLSMPAE